MATQSATLIGVDLVDARPGSKRKVFKCHVTFPAYTGASDSATFAAVGAAIAAFRRDGKTFTLRDGAGGLPGHDGSQDVYVGECAVSGAALNFNLVNASGTELSSAAATTKAAQILVTVDES